jgi:streptogramin lyase
MVKRTILIVLGIFIVTTAVFSVTLIQSYQQGRIYYSVPTGYSEYKIALDEKNQVWACYTSRYGMTSISSGTVVEYVGVFREDKVVATYELINANASDLSDIGCNSIVVDKRSNVWVGYHDGLRVFDGKKWSKVEISIPNLDSINTLAVDDSGKVWVGSSNGLNIFDGKSLESFPKNSLLRNESVNAIAFDGNNRVWIGTDSGLYVFDGTDWQSYRAAEISNITSVAVDNEGIVWVGYDNGVATFDGSSWILLTSDNSGLTDEVNPRVQKIFIDHQGRVWILTWSLLGYIIVYDGVGWNYYLDTNGGRNKFSSADVDSKGNVWLASIDNNVGFLKLSPEVKLMSKFTGTLLMFMTTGGMWFVILALIFLSLAYALNSWKGIGLGFGVGALIGILSVASTFLGYSVDRMLYQEPFFSFFNFAGAGFAIMIGGAVGGLAKINRLQLKKPYSEIKIVFWGWALGLLLFYFVFTLLIFLFQ